MIPALIAGRGSRYYGSAGGGGGGEELGNVVSYANLSVGNAGMQTLDTSLGDTPTHVTGDASVSTNASYGISRYGTRCFPPDASGEYSAIGGLDLFNAGSPATVKRLYTRWCVQVGSAWSANNTFDAVKHLILLYGSPTDTRPMIYLDGNPGSLGIGPANTSVIVPAQGTTKLFCEDYPTGFTAYDGDNRFDCYLGAGAATTVTDPSNSHVRQVLAATEWVCVELITDSTSPTGLIRQRVTRQDGSVLSDLAVDWDYGSATFDSELTGVDVLGGYYNGGTGTAGANNYIAIDRYISFEANRADFAGPPPGFLT